VRATLQDGSYPRPMLCREHWISLDGTWEFGYDDDDEGVAARWFDQSASGPFTRQIRVPYPPESPASLIGDRQIHPVVWYRRRIPRESLPNGRDGHRVLIHFGAVDFRAQVWFDGQLICRHVGGQTPFTADVTQAMAAGTDEYVLVVRAEDHPDDLEQPRGKRALRLLEQPRFRSAFDLLMLRAQLGLAPAEIAAWWTQLQAVAPEQRPALLDTLTKPRGPASLAGESAVDAGVAAPERSAPRRRRRRRYRGPA